MREDWVDVELGGVCVVSMGQSPPSSTYNTDKKGLPFFQGKAEFTTLHPVVQKWCNKPKKTAEVDDILLSVRAPVGATNIANQKCAIGRGLAAITYTPYKYIFYYLKLIESKLDTQGTGTTFKAISGKVLKSQIVPLAPQPEQRAIVAKIEQLFSELDNGIANLKTAKDKLEIYRQAVLKKAFEGELTKGWREKQIDLPSADQLLEQIKTKCERHHDQQFTDWQTAVQTWAQNSKPGKKPTKPKKPKNTFQLVENDLSEKLPGGWGWLLMGDLAKEMCLGKMLDKSKNKGGLLPYIGNINVRWGKFELGNLKEMRFEVHESDRYGLEYGDLVLCEGGEPGRCAIWKSNKDMRIQKALHRIRFWKQQTSPDFVYYYMQFSADTGRINKHFTGTTINHLTGKGLRQVLIPICSKEEQTQIVKEIETRLSVCENAMKNIDEALKKSEALRQSILKKAFEGKLLSDAELQACRQEPDWEPAEKLLERIKKEKK